MKKSLFSEDYKCFLKLLREAREQAGLTQEQIAARLETTQSIISKCERGERRLDIVELKAWCQALGISLPVFIAEFEKAIDRGNR
jgi:transcriptional regulator with XRE-family HTH domain